jgi:hypothetical protein
MSFSSCSSFQRKLESSSCLSLVIPACSWRESSDFVFLFLAFKSKGFHSPVGRAGSFLCSCKERNQRNTPQSIAPFVHPARRVRVIGRVPLMAHPCATAECARSIAHTPLGPGRPLPPQCNGDPEKPEQRAPARRSNVKGAPFRLRHLPPLRRGRKSFASPAQRLKGALLLLPLGSPSAAARAGRNRPKGRAQERASSRMGRMPIERTPAGTRAPPQAARLPGCVLFGYFLLHKQEKVTRAPDARGIPNGHGAKESKAKSLDFRQKRAGMTIKGTAIKGTERERNQSKPKRA